METGLIFCIERGTAMDPSGHGCLCRRAGIPQAAPHTFGEGLPPPPTYSAHATRTYRQRFVPVNRCQTINGYVATRPGTNADFAAFIEASLSEP